MSWLFASGGQSIGASASVLPMNIQNLFPLELTGLAFESVLMRWMKLEPIIQSEVSQKEKHQYSILMHIYEI